MSKSHLLLLTETFDVIYILLHSLYVTLICIIAQRLFWPPGAMKYIITYIFHGKWCEWLSRTDPFHFPSTWTFWYFWDGDDPLDTFVVYILITFIDSSHLLCITERWYMSYNNNILKCPFPFHSSLEGTISGIFHSLQLSFSSFVGICLSVCISFLFAMVNILTHVSLSFSECN